MCLQHHVSNTEMVPHHSVFGKLLNYHQRNSSATMRKQWTYTIYDILLVLFCLRNSRLITFRIQYICQCVNSHFQSSFSVLLTFIWLDVLKYKPFVLASHKNNLPVICLCIINLFVIDVVLMHGAMQRGLPHIIMYWPLLTSNTKQRRLSIA